MHALPSYAIPYHYETTADGTPIVGYVDDWLPVFRYGPEQGSTPEQRAEFIRGLEAMARLGAAEW